MSEPATTLPLDLWLIDMGETVVRISHDEFARIESLLVSLSTRVIQVTDIYGSDTRIMRDKILHTSRSTPEICAAARKHLRAFNALTDDLDPVGADKVWEK